MFPRFLNAIAYKGKPKPNFLTYGRLFFNLTCPNRVFHAVAPGGALQFIKTGKAKSLDEPLEKKCFSFILV
jgi:hypothetical protein